MILKLQRPDNDDGEGPWLMLSEFGERFYINATDELRVMMAEDQSGYFEAEPEGGGWDIRRRVGDQGG